jgi:uroporphyrinogen-III synthase
MIAYLDKGLVDVITFTSPSTVVSFREIMGQGFSLPSGVRVAAIGPVTAAAVRKEGFPVHVLQETYTIPGLTAALADAFRHPESA